MSTRMLAGYSNVEIECPISNLYEDLGMIFVFVGFKGFISAHSECLISNVNEEVSMIFKC